MGISNFVGDCERSVPQVTFLTRLGAWGLLRDKRATACKLIPRKYEICYKEIITMVRERARLPVAII
jgi:hypothetical protein